MDEMLIRWKRGHGTRSYGEYGLGCVAGWIAAKCMVTISTMAIFLQSFQHQGTGRREFLSDSGKKKIGLFLSGLPAQGGTFQYNLSILDAMAALPKDDFVVVAGCLDKSWQPLALDRGIECFVLPYHLAGRFVALVWRGLCLPERLWCLLAKRWHGTVRAMAKGGFDLWVFPSQDCWSYQGCVPALVSILDLMHRYERSFSEVSRWGRFQRLENHYQKICKASAGILVDSETGRQQVLQSYLTEPNKVFPLPYVPPSYLLTVNDTVTSRSFDLPEKFLFYPAQFWAHKNHDRLLKAIARLVPDLPDLHLVLVGEPKGAYRSIRQQIAKLGLEKKVTHLGYVSTAQMRNLYGCARALIMPTLFGPTNIPPLEAMALGCPVAVSNNYAMPEQVGDAGVLFNPESIGEIADAIIRLWSDDALCADLSRRGKEQSQLWTQEHFNKRLEHVISSILCVNSV
jgi:glycosyltransferase involved in cell wall biosynthesis